METKKKRGKSSAIAIRESKETKNQKLRFHLSPNGNTLNECKKEEKKNDSRRQHTNTCNQMQNTREITTKLNSTK